MSNKLVRSLLVATPLALAVGVGQAAEGLSITPMIGYQTYDNQFKNDEVYGLGLGYHFGNGFAVEGAAHFGGAGIIDNGSVVDRYSNADGVDRGHVETQQYRVEGQYWIPTDSIVNPYLSFGLGSMNVTAIKVGDNSLPGGATAREKDDGSYIMSQFGAGLGVDVSEELMLRGDYRYGQWDMNHGVNEVDDHQFALGLSWLPFNAVAPVPVPVVVPEPVDSDGDGVFDDADQCPGTAAGVVVVATGCPLDSDGDNVPDGLDQCPNSAPGANVDAVGCEIIEEVIPAPVIVVADSDGDGVNDDVDACPNTPYGTQVDASGCPFQKVLETQTVSKNLAVYFNTDSATLTPESYAEVQSLADFMNEYPTTVVVVEGHTDSTGAAAYNKNLSQERADAVAYALSSKYGIDYSRVSAVGYGEEYPIADNKTRDGRALNRRVVAVINETVTIGQ